MMMVRWGCGVVGFVMVRGVVMWCSNLVYWSFGRWGRRVCVFVVEFVWCGDSCVIVFDLVV